MLSFLRKIKSCKYTEKTLRELLEKRAHEFAAVEDLEVIYLLAHSDELDRNLELVADADDHAALCGAVKLCDGQCADRGCLCELPGLDEAVLACGAVDDEQDLVRGVRNHLRHHVLYLRQLVHQVHLVVKTAAHVADGVVEWRHAAGLVVILGDVFHLVDWCVFIDYFLFASAESHQCDELLHIRMHLIHTMMN